MTKFWVEHVLNVTRTLHGWEKRNKPQSAERKLLDSIGWIIQLERLFTAILLSMFIESSQNGSACWNCRFPIELVAYRSRNTYYIQGFSWLDSILVSKDYLVIKIFTRFINLTADDVGCYQNVGAHLIATSAQSDCRFLLLMNNLYPFRRVSLDNFLWFWS